MLQLKESIKGLSIITSCVCNLDCKYCQIAMNKTPMADILQKNTIDALKDGSFIKNIRSVLHRLHQSPGLIEQIDLWGQEPTLTLPYLTDHIDEWLTAFPNWHKTFFSSNGIAFGESILDFILALDVNLNRNFELSIQFSYDGDISNTAIRKADSIAIEQTVYKLILALNEKTLSHVKLHLHLHGVTSLEVIKLLNNDTEQIFQYFDNATAIIDILAKLNRNKNVSVVNFVTFSFENPLTTSSDDALLISNFYKKCLKIPTHNFTYNQTGQSIINLAQLIEKFQTELGRISCNYREILSTIANESDWVARTQLINRLSDQSFCATMVGELKIMYDGTCIFCQNILHKSHETEPIKNDGTIRTGVLQSFQEHNIYLNPLNESDENLQKIFNRFYHGKRTNFIFMYSNIVNLMLRLVQVRQIDSSYQNLEKILEHALYLTIINSCPYNHYIETGSLYGKTVGMIRAYCNGLLDDCLNVLALIHPKIENCEDNCHD